MVCVLRKIINSTRVMIKSWQLCKDHISIESMNDVYVLEKGIRMGIVNRLYKVWLRQKEQNTRFYRACMNNKWVSGILIRILYNNSTISNMNSVEKLGKILADDISRETLNMIVAARNKWLFSSMHKVHKGEQYFCLEEFQQALTEEEALIDGGAYIGDTLERFIYYTSNNYSAVYCFEPDLDNFNLLVKNIEDKELKNVNAYPMGLWDKSEKLYFAQGRAASSTISEFGGITIDVTSIDDIIDNEKNITYIKLDVEGAELKALEGAKNTIQRCHPKLAVCIYHRPEDLWKIPFYIHSEYPFYNLYIRHHSDSYIETVLYAIPVE